MAKRKVVCKLGEKRWTVLVAGSDPYDSAAARSFEQAKRALAPDRGSKLTVWSVCASDAGAARLPGVYKKRGYVTSVRRVKRQGR